MRACWITQLIAVTSLSFGLHGLHAQSSDALLQKLVEKGILTTQEAKDLEKEAKSGVKKDIARGMGMPDWVTSIRLSGDFRGRFEQNAASNDAYFDRNRYRYRARLGLTTTLLDNFELGLRLASGNPVTSPGGTLVGGSPVTANQDLNSLESRKFIWLDAAYAKWTAIKTDDWTLSGTIGKMDNPFLLSNMVFDYDVNPEGAALQLAHKLGDKHDLKANAGIFVLDELNQGNPSGSTLPTGVKVSSSHDPFFYGGQTLVQSRWTPAFETSLGVALFSIESRDSLSAKAQPFYNAGNSRDTNGFLAHGFLPVIGMASATYSLGSFVFYPGAFPIKVSGEFMHNTQAPDHNEGWRVGLTLGKAGKRRAWELGYRYQQLEADAWFDALVDDDNGAFYAGGNPQLTGTGRANGWFGGTNVKGHQVVAIYSFTDFLNLSLTFYSNDAIVEAPAETSSATHFMADLNWRF